MSKKKLVRCLLRSPGEAPYTKYVPLSEFKLWKYYMKNAHGKIIEGEDVSVWLDSASFDEAVSNGARPVESVTRISVEYWDAAEQTTNQVERFFPSDGYDDIRETFLTHYPDRSEDGKSIAQRRVSETEGYYLLPRVHSEQKIG